ncbi:D-hexose-6-phosphate mutarotase [Marinobacter sp. JSM 1782161]|uniref:D-hexose-6-phosphate mutarotase n=1 Tax=Marinobacter sp. JSM 1782161 TaxID=2685906 RepID=UPI001A9F133B|nr:D-hexose-6-phosphate mutarotase [Marinobacter sp. JSM 1782161]
MTSSKAEPIFATSITVGDLDAIDIKHPAFSARVFLQGAHLTHFAPTGESNWLWLSPDTRFTPGKAIRGGIPVCWPWFGDPARNPPAVVHRIASSQAHGFARATPWTLLDIIESEDSVELALTLDAADVSGKEASREHGDWPLRGEIRFRFSQAQCVVTLTTHNTGQTDITYTEALHTYLPSDAVDSTALAGLDGVTYTDTLDDWREKTQSGPVRFEGETDRIYQGSSPILVQAPGVTTRLETQGSLSTVVWNPGPEKAQRLSDFPDAAWKTMLCVETANAYPDCVRLMQGQSHTTELVLTRE